MRVAPGLAALLLVAACSGGSGDAGKVYLPQFGLPFGQSEVLVYSYPDLDIRGRIVSGNLAIHAAKRPGSDELWVSCENSGDIALIDTRKDSALLRFPLGLAAQGGAFTPDGSLFVVANGAMINKSKSRASASIVDADSRTILAKLDLGADPYDVAVSSDGLEAYVACNGDSSIARIDLAGRRVLDIVEAAPGPYSLTVDSADGLLYAACRGRDEDSPGVFLVYALPGLEVRARIESEMHPVQVLLHGDDCLLLEAEGSSRGRLRRVEPGSLEPGPDSWTLELGGVPGLAGISPGGRWMLIPVGGTEILCVDLARGRVRNRRVLPQHHQRRIVMDLAVD